MLLLCQTASASWAGYGRGKIVESYERSLGLHTYAGRSSLDTIVSQGFSYDWQNEIVGDSVVSGNGPWTVRHRELWQQAAQGLDGIATYTLVDEGGTLKIARHSWAGFNWYGF